MIEKNWLQNFTKSEKDSWIGEARDFYVCPVCGYTSETEEEHERCPVCNCPWEKFEIIR